MASTGAKKAPKKSAAIPAALRNIVGIHVKFTLNTPDGLRRVIFELRKSTEGDKVTWTINFQLFERQKKTDDFGDAIVNLEIGVDSKLNNKAEAMADNGMNDKQASFVLGPGGDAAKDAEAGKISDAKAKTTIQNTLKK